MTDPNGCRHCGIAQRGHGRQHVPGAGWHPWTPPTQDQIKQRMTDRSNPHLTGYAPEPDLDERPAP